MSDKLKELVSSSKEKAKSELEMAKKHLSNASSILSKELYFIDASEGIDEFDTNVECMMEDIDVVEECVDDLTTIFDKWSPFNG